MRHWNTNTRSDIKDVHFLFSSLLFNEFSVILKNMGLNYSYLTENEAEKELKAAKTLTSSLK